MRTEKFMNVERVKRDLQTGRSSLKCLLSRNRNTSRDAKGLNSADCFRMLVRCCQSFRNVQEANLASDSPNA
jgi:hypothetical protein